MMNYRRLTAFVSLFVLAQATPAIAQEAEDANQLTVGVGAGLLPSYSGSDDYNLTPGALVRGKLADFTFFSRGANLYVDAVRDDHGAGLDFELGPVVNLRSERHSRIKDPQVRALGKLDRAWEAGGWVGLAKSGVFTSAYDNLSARIVYLKDVGGAHKSYVISPAMEYGAPLSPTTYVGVSISADYVGKGFGHYYYDIDLAGSQASGLGVYAAAGDKAGFAKLNLGIVGAKSLSGDLRKGWAVFGLGGYGRMLGRYADSPLVKDAGDRNQWLGGLGLAYSF